MTLQQTITGVLAALHTDATPLDDVFADRSAPERVTIKAAFTGLVIPVALGYPRAAAELPGVYVVLGAAHEADQVIGEEFHEQYLTNPTPPPAALGWDVDAGTWMQTSMRLCCWTLNANLTVWLQTVVWWALLGTRDVLTSAGYTEQRIGATDFEPLPGWFPDFAYRRDVTLTTKYVVTVRTRVLPVRAIDLTETSEDETFTAVIPRH